MLELCHQCQDTAEPFDAVQIKQVTGTTNPLIEVYNALHVGLWYTDIITDQEVFDNPSGNMESRVALEPG